MPVYAGKDTTLLFSRQSHRQNCEEVLSQSKPRDGMDPGIGSIVAPFWDYPIGF